MLGKTYEMDRGDPLTDNLKIIVLIYQTKPANGCAHRTQITFATNSAY